MLDNVRQQLQQRIAQLTEEADRLRQALSALGHGSAPSSTPNPRARTGQGRGRGRAAQTEPASRRRSAGARSSQPAARSGRRAAPGGTKARVLEALAGGDAMTASDVAAKTGLGRASVSTTLSKLAQSGEVQKADRGYRIAPGSARAN